MRVIAGEYRGRKLDCIKGMDIRPTADKVKESLFNILGDSVIGSRFLDLFAGTGGVGIEALSRGAENAVFIDANAKSIKVLKGNLNHLNINSKAEVFPAEYKTAIQRLYKYNKHFDIIFIDPPYDCGMAENALEMIDKNPILSKSGLIVVEHDSKGDLPQRVGRLYLYRIKQYGNTALSFYQIEEQTQ